MISISSYNLLSIIACGEVTVHVLHRGVLERTKSLESADEILLSGILELARKNLAIFSYHDDYGNLSSVRKISPNIESIIGIWKSIFKFEGPRSEFPDPSTLTLEITEAGVKELDKDIYLVYENLLDKWYN